MNLAPRSPLPQLTKGTTRGSRLGAGPCQGGLKTRATIEVQHFFSNTTYPTIWKLKTCPSQELIWRKLKLVPRAKSHRLCSYKQRESREKQHLFPDDFGLRSPVVQIYFQPKSDALIVVRVSSPKRDHPLRLVVSNAYGEVAETDMGPIYIF